MTSQNDRVVIVGGGLAGLCCARSLHDKGVPFTLLESSDAVGGRIRTDRVNGFLLDRGFQIMLTAYPEAIKILDFGELNMKPFFPGAVVRSGGKFYHVADPFRSPLHAFETLCAPVGNFKDKLQVAMLRAKVMGESKEDEIAHGSMTTMAVLEREGFSSTMIRQFFRPLFAGIFLEQNLDTSAAVFDFVFRMLAKGDNALPANGMQAIPEQIAAKLPSGSIKLNHPVAKVDKNVVTLANGQEIIGRAVVVATEDGQCRVLTGHPDNAKFRSQTCVYFSSDVAPFDEPAIVLNGEQDGLVTNFSVQSNVAPTYAPKGKALMAAVIVGDAELDDSKLESAVRNQMKEWYGAQVNKWEHLRTYRIKYALPDQSPEALAETPRNYRNGGSVYYCGDYKETGSINGAMESGRKAAEAALTDLR